MKNGGEATSRFRVTRIQELRNMVGWNRPWPRMVECAWIFYLILFSGVDYLLGFYDNDKSKGMGLYIIQSSPRQVSVDCVALISDKFNTS